MKTVVVAILVLLATAGAYLQFSGSGTTDDGLAEPVVTPKKIDQPLTPKAGTTGTELERQEPGPVREVVQDDRAFPQGIEGRVIAATGGAVAGAQVYLLHGVSPTNLIQQIALLGGLGGKPPARIAASGNTDENGNFKIPSPVTEGVANFQLRIRAPKHLVHERSLRIVALRWERLGVITLGRGRTLHGIVRDSKTKATIEGATVRFASGSLNIMLPTPGMEDGLETMTTAGGKYEIEGLTEGPAQLIAFARGYGTYRKADFVFAKGAWSATENIELPTGYAIDGRVTDADGQPVPHARVQASPLAGPAPNGSHARSHADGTFELLGLAAGEYAVSAQADGFTTNEHKQVAAGTSNVEIVLEQQAHIKVRVLGSGRPLKRYRIEVNSYDPTHGGYGRTNIPAVTVRNASNGETTIKGLNPGTYVVQITASGFAKTFSDGFMIAAAPKEPSSVLVQMKKGGQIHGVVTDDSGKPVAGTVVATLAKGYMDHPFGELARAFSTSSITEATERTNKRGEFRLKLLAPGGYQLRVDHPSYPRIMKKGLELEEGQDLDVGSIRLSVGGEIKGIVYIDGTPKVAVKVTLTSSAKDGAGVFLTTFTNAKGEFAFARRLAPGKYEVHAMRSDHGHILLGIVDARKSRKVVTVRQGVQRVTIQLSSHPK